VQESIVGNYQIEEKLAEGGMGAVYRATHQLLGRPAAVKVLLPQLSSNHELVTRFFNEARAATAIRHPGIVEIYDFGYTEAGAAYLVMELLEGEVLSRRLHRGRLDEATALTFTRGIASALAAAHAKGIVHRDLKPDNVFLVPDPDMPAGVRPKLLDFGVAKVAEAARSNEMTKTRTGSLLGTPTYMSPEQCRGSSEVDHRTDLYALGCILYEMVTGQPPFSGEGVGEVIGKHQFVAPTPPSQVVPSVSKNVESLVMSLLAKAPADRIQTATELVRMLGAGSIMEGLHTPMPTPVPFPSATAPRTATPMATTLGTAASEITLQPRSSQQVVDVRPARRGGHRKLWAVLALAIGLAGGVGVMTFARDRSSTSATPDTETETRPKTMPASAAPPTTPPPAEVTTQTAPPSVDAGVAVDAAAPRHHEQETPTRASSAAARSQSAEQVQRDDPTERAGTCRPQRLEPR
jgi:eukaryotic-like serine/threonine-protein kinase